MTDTSNTAIAAALQALATAVAALRPAVAPTKVHDPFATNDPFDLDTRSGSSAYSTISSPLDQLWDGAVESFPSFLVAVRIRAKQGKWNATGDEGILSIDVDGKSKELLTAYHSITDAAIEIARVARTNARAMQNSKAMYSCLKSSITGSIKNSIFSQYGNLPPHEDGVAFFKQLTTFTTVASLQLSTISFSNILHFNPFDYDFDISVINSKLLNLFILATTSTREILEGERLQHTLHVYEKIVQPEKWAQWVRIKTMDFGEGKISNCQDFMNLADLQYKQILSSGGGQFKGSITTVTEDIVAMMATSKKRKPPPPFDNEREPKFQKKDPPLSLPLPRPRRRQT